MAFQLTRLNVPNLTTDYSAETNAAASLAKTIGGMPAEWRKQQEAATQKQILGSLGEDIKRGDFQSAASKAFALGDIQAGATISTLGQKAKEQQREADWMKNNAGLFGGAATGGGAAPVVPGTASLIQNESGGNWRAQNDATGAGGAKGHFGRAQFGQARLQEAAAAGAIPPGTTPQQFMASPELQQRAEQWHFSDIDQAIKQNGYDRLVGQQINGVPVTVEGLRAVAHLGGKEGMRKFVETQGRYNPADVNGTRLSGYFARHGGQGGAAPQVAQAPSRGVAPIPGDDPIKLRQEAEAYRQSNPEAARQMLARADAAERGAGVQTAQAPGGDPRADQTPGTGAPTQFVIPGTTPAQTQSILSDPAVQKARERFNTAPTERTRAIAKQDLDLAIADARTRVDEGGPLTQEGRRLANEAARRKLEEGDQTSDIKEYNLYRRQAAESGKTPDDFTTWQRANKAAGRTQITNTNAFDAKGEGKFNEALGAAQAKRWNAYIEEGDVAQNRLADIQTLRETSRRLGSQGSSANLKALVGPYAESLGIKVEGLGDIQLYESITNRLAPTLRAPGSGSTSDIEFKGFMRAIGPLSNTPAAREMILDTFEAASRNDLARSEIASRLASGDINRQQAEKEIRALPNPLEGFRKFREANPDLVGQAIKETGQRAALEKNGPPKITSPEMASKLPSGTEFIDPNGIKRRVP